MINSTDICNVQNVSNANEYANKVMYTMIESYEGLSELVLMLIHTKLDSETIKFIILVILLCFCNDFWNVFCIFKIRSYLKWYHVKTKQKIL